MAPGTAMTVGEEKLAENKTSQICSKSPPLTVCNSLFQFGTHFTFSHRLQSGSI